MRVKFARALGSFQDYEAMLNERTLVHLPSLTFGVQNAPEDRDNWSFPITFKLVLDISAKIRKVG
jgi:hypothetical protein